MRQSCDALGAHDSTGRALSRTGWRGREALEEAGAIGKRPRSPRKKQTVYCCVLRPGTSAAPPPPGPQFVFLAQGCVGRHVAQQGRLTRAPLRNRCSRPAQLSPPLSPAPPPCTAVQRSGLCLAPLGNAQWPHVQLLHLPRGGCWVLNLTQGRMLARQPYARATLQAALKCRPCRPACACASSISSPLSYIQPAPPIHKPPYPSKRSKTTASIALLAPPRSLPSPAWRTVQATRTGCTSGPAQPP